MGERGGRWMGALKGVAWLEALEAIEAAWLGWSQPPPGLVLREAGWRADAPGDYCGRCGVSASAQERTGGGCGTCRGHPAPADAIVRLGRYAVPLRDWVRGIKYRRWSAMAAALGRELGRAVRPVLGGEDAVVVPMPMPWARRLHRGIDHAHALAMAVAAEIRAPLRSPLRRAEGPPQVTLGSANRARGAGGVGLAGSRAARSLAGRTVVLVDDVCTTGASLRRASLLLRRTGPRRVVAAVLAVTDPAERRGRQDAGPRPQGRLSRPEDSIDAAGRGSD